MARVRLFTASILTSLAICGAASAAQPPFKGVVVFGDSLSDNGNISIASGSPQRARFTTNPGLVAIEQVGQHYGFTLAPSLAGGTDFAFGGAGINTNSPGTPSTVPTVTAQITGYLAANKTLDPHTLYSVWGGANDIFYHAQAAGAGAVADQLVAQKTAGLPPAIAAVVAAQIRAQVAAGAGVASVETSDQAGQAVLAAAQQEVSLIGQMKAAGARYVLVFNLPDTGATPAAASLGASAQASLTALAVNYNNVLNGGLGVIGTGIVPVNTFALVREIAASPQAYGFTNVTTPACTTPSSINCTPATLVNPNAPNTYLFADGVHPTTGAHAALGQVVVSELVAPQQMSVLAETPLAFLQSHRSAVGNELMLDTIAPGEGARVFATGSFGRRTLRGDIDAPRSKNDDSVATLGVDWRRGEAVSFGAALTGGHSTAKLQDHSGGFKADELIGSIFGQYQWRRQAYVNGLVGFGSADYRDVERAFNIAAARRIERSQANGSDVTAVLTGGYWFDVSGLRTGPFATVSYDRVRVERFAETSGDSTAMHFEAQTREALIGKLGWKLQGAWRMGGATLYPMLSAAYAHDDKADQRFVSAGLTSLNGEFSMPGYSPDKNWGEAEVGLNAAFGNGVGAYAAYQGRFSGRTQDNIGSVGLKYSF